MWVLGGRRRKGQGQGASVGLEHYEGETRRGFWGGSLAVVAEGSGSMLLAGRAETSLFPGVIL